MMHTHDDDGDDAQSLQGMIMMHTDSNGDDDALICITVPKREIHVDNANAKNKCKHL